MFGLFKKKDKGVPVTDHIWMTEQAKWQACLDFYLQNKQTVFVAWFEESRNKLKAFFAAKGVTDTVVYDAGFYNTMPANNDQVIFVEHFPLQETEQQKFRDLALQKAVVYTSLDEALFGAFGGEKIVQLMLKMGMKENEAIQHSMVTAAIKRAQEKLAAKAIISGSSKSQRDWLQSAGISNDVNG
jgi:hypothetical protein